MNLLLLLLFIACAQCCPYFVTSHRGAHTGELQAPENSIHAFLEAVRLGTHKVELDIMRTSDGVYVIHHDSTLDRTTNCSGQLSQATFSYLLQNCILDDNRLWLGELQRIPTLQECVDLASNNSVQLYLDIKGGDLKEILDIINSRDWISQSWVFGGPAAAREYYPEINLLPTSSSVEQTMALLSQFDPPPQGFELPNQMQIDEENIALIHSVGSLVFQDVLGGRDVQPGWLDVMEKGVDCIQTDYPQRLIPFIGEYCNNAVPA